MTQVLELSTVQLGFDLGEAKVDAPYEPDPNEIRNELSAILDTARAAVSTPPWDTRTILYHKVVFPQMARWLPDDERERLCAAFSNELERIERVAR